MMIPQKPWSFAALGRQYAVDVFTLLAAGRLQIVYLTQEEARHLRWSVGLKTPTTGGIH
jgi:hypothetical protein